VKGLLGTNFGESLRKLLGYDGKGPLPSVTHYLLAGLPSSNIVTTNYDVLIEDTYKYMKKIAFTISKPSDVVKIPISDYHTNILKIHGDINSPDEIIISKDDYDNFFDKRPAVAALLKGLLLNRSFLFLGYSLRDPNLKAIIDEVGQLLQDSKRPCYAIVFDADQNDIIQWNNKGVHILKLSGFTNLEKTFNLWRFIDQLQLSYFSSQGAWLAPDSGDFIPQDMDTNLKSNLETIKNSIVELSNNLKDDPIIMDFALPFLTLGSKYGLTLPPGKWKMIADHYGKRTITESNILNQLKALVVSLEMSCGRGEEVYLKEIEQLSNKHFLT